MRAIPTTRVSFSATSGVTPATIRVTIDPSAYSSSQRNHHRLRRIDSSTAVNLQPASCPLPGGTGSYAAGCFRLLINNRNPDQRGTVVNVPGLLVDLLADPSRNRFYIIRQTPTRCWSSTHRTMRKSAPLRTRPTPMQMASPPIISTCWWDSRRAFHVRLRFGFAAAFHLGAHVRRPLSALSRRFGPRHSGPLRAWPAR